MTVLMKTSSNLTDRQPASKNVSTKAEDIVEIRHQTTTSEDTADWEDSVRAVVNWRECKLAKPV
jgi:hypothetical protein